MSLPPEQKAELRELAPQAESAIHRMESYPEEIIDISQHEGEQIDIDINIINHFHQLANPSTILSLLAELDEKDKRIAELEAISAASEKLVRCKGRYHSEQNYRALAALFGVTTPELPPLEEEARTVSVKLPPAWLDGEGPVMNADEVRAILIEAGIKLEVGE